MVTLSIVIGASATFTEAGCRRLYDVCIAMQHPRMKCVADLNSCLTSARNPPPPPPPPRTPPPTQHGAPAISPKQKKFRSFRSHRAAAYYFSQHQTILTFPPTSKRPPKSHIQIFRMQPTTPTHTRRKSRRRETHGRVLSIQSHVVHGIVGNKAATFPLQLLGFQVDPLNTVQFSNHTGYPKFTGDRMEGVIYFPFWRDTWVEKLRYCRIGDIEEIEKCKPGYSVVDPVMGDEGRLYVPSELLPIYRDSLCALADVITPNAFEADVTSTETAKQCLTILHHLGPKIVIITSSVLSDKPESTLTLLAVCHVHGDRGSACCALVGVFNSEKVFDGKDGVVERFGRAVECAVAGMQGVLGATVERALEEGGAGGFGGGTGWRGLKCRELLVAESRDEIEDPIVEYRVERI
ncbi:Ribokinase-like protein [Chytridium lagenaria]|nr:Ribokinase-like protein [Chytridium lagenaria]